MNLATRKRKKKKSIFPKIILVVFVLYAVTTIISNQIKANRFDEETKGYNEMIVTETMKKEKIKQELAAEIDDEYVTREAQKQGYASPNERVFTDISGR